MIRYISDRGATELVDRDGAQQVEKYYYIMKG